MAHFSDKGRHCSDPYCRQMDFLPMTCDGCGEVFCSEHFKYEAHSCPKGRATTDKRVIVCPLCSQAVPLPYGEDENVVWERHASSGECRPICGVVAKPRCPVPGCKEKLTTLNTYSCGTCHKKVCLKHRFEDLHECKPAAQSSQRSATSGSGRSGRDAASSLRSLREGFLQQASQQVRRLVK